MNGNKIWIILILAVISIVMFDMLTKYLAKKGAIDLESERQAQINLLKQQQLAGSIADDGKGALGGLLDGIPIIGGLF